MKVTNLPFGEMVQHFIDALNTLDYDCHEDSIGWLFPEDGWDTWEFLEMSVEQQRLQFSNRVKGIIKDRQKSSLYSSTGLANDTVNGVRYLDKLNEIADKVINNTKWVLSSLYCLPPHYSLGWHSLGIQKLPYRQYSHC